jgi:hypothetical protein
MDHITARYATLFIDEWLRLYANLTISTPRPVQTVHYQVKKRNNATQQGVIFTQGAYYHCTARIRRRLRESILNSDSNMFALGGCIV